MQTRFQDIVDPIACVDQNRHYSVQLQVDSLPRLYDLVLPSDRHIEADIQFYREGRFAKAKLRIHANLMLQCNTCLKPIDWQMEHLVDLAMVKTPDEFDMIPDDCEPWLLEQRNASLIELIEDEMLLLLPQVPKHEDCSIILPPQTQATDFIDDAEVVEEKKNPFDVLRTFKPNVSAGDD